MTNLKGEVTYINAALCIILDEGKPENVLGKDIMAYYSLQEQQKLKDTIMPAVFQQGQWLGEMPILSTKGKLTSTIQNIFFVRDNTRNPLYVANIITESLNTKGPNRQSGNQRRNIAVSLKNRWSVYTS